MLYCRACAADFDRRFGRPALANQHFLDARPCELCKGQGPTAGLVSKDAVSGQGSRSAHAKPPTNSGHRQGRPVAKPATALDSWWRNA